MKKFVKFALLAALLSTVFGCATSGEKFEARLAPPDTFNQVFMRYKELPSPKVIVIAVDPGGRWAYGYDQSEGSMEEIAQNAAVRCDDARKKYKIFNKAKIFAINNDVIYYDQVK